MRLIVLSDSHGDDDTLRWMLEQCWKQVGPVDAYVHCGDGMWDFGRVEQFILRRDPTACLLGVKGNNDCGVDAPDRRVAHLGGAGIFITHGHNYRVKSTLDYVDRAAQEAGCSITLYGHTHIADMEMRRTLLINPGAACRGRLAVLEINDGKLRVDLLAF